MSVRQSPILSSMRYYFNQVFCTGPIFWIGPMSLDLCLYQKTPPDSMLKELDRIVNKDKVSCLQHLHDKKWCITLKSANAANRLQSHPLTRWQTFPDQQNTRAKNLLKCVQCPYGDGECSGFNHGKIISHRRGHWKTHQTWLNRVRRYAIILTKSIPSFFKKKKETTIRITYNGQIPTGGICNEQGHTSFHDALLLQDTYASGFYEARG